MATKARVPGQGRLRVIPVILLSLIMGIGSSAAYASGLYGGAGLDLCNPSDGSGQYYADFGYGGGLYWEVPRPGSHLMPEIDLFFIRRIFSSGKGSASYNYASNIIEVPAMVRLHLGENFSIAGGVYIADLLGNLSYANAVGSGESKYSRPVDYGWLVSTRVEFTAKVPRPVFLEVRYTGGLANLSSTGQTLHYYDLQFLFGVRLGGGNDSKTITKTSTFGR